MTHTPEFLTEIDYAEIEQRWLALYATGSAVLTPRQDQIAGLTASGWSRIDIARELRVSTATINVTERNLFEKLDIHDRRALILLWPQSRPPEVTPKFEQRREDFTDEQRLVIDRIGTGSPHRQAVIGTMLDCEQYKFRISKLLLRLNVATTYRLMAVYRAAKDQGKSWAVEAYRGIKLNT